MKFLPIDKSKLPYTFTLVIDGERLRFRARYNAQAGMFMLDVYSGSEPIALGRPLLYGRDALFGVTDPRVQSIGIFPWTNGGLAEEITPSNFMLEVKPWLLPRVR
jgi:hypothetical protein